MVQAIPEYKDLTVEESRKNAAEASLLWQKNKL